MVRQEFRFAMSHWIADPHPAKYQYAIPFINVCLTYPHLRELLKAELTRWGFSYDELVIQGTGEIAHVVSDELANRYLYNTMQYSRLDGLTLQTNDEKEKIERIERGIKKVVLDCQLLTRKCCI